MICFTRAKIGYDTPDIDVPKQVYDRFKIVIEDSKSLDLQTSSNLNMCGRDSIQSKLSTMNLRKLESDILHLDIPKVSPPCAMPITPSWVQPETINVWNQFVVGLVGRIIVNFWASSAVVSPSILKRKTSPTPGRFVSLPNYNIHVASCDSDTLETIKCSRDILHTRVPVSELHDALDDLAVEAIWRDINLGLVLTKLLLIWL